MCVGESGGLVSWRVENKRWTPFLFGDQHTSNSVDHAKIFVTKAMKASICLEALQLTLLIFVEDFLVEIERDPSNKADILLLGKVNGVEEQ